MADPLHHHINKLAELDEVIKSEDIVFILYKALQSGRFLTGIESDTDGANATALFSEVACNRTWITTESRASISDQDNFLWFASWSVGELTLAPDDSTSEEVDREIEESSVIDSKKKVGDVLSQRTDDLRPEPVLNGGGLQFLLDCSGDIENKLLLMAELLRSNGRTSTYSEANVRIASSEGLTSCWGKLNSSRFIRNSQSRRDSNNGHKE